MCAINHCPCAASGLDSRPQGVERELHGVEDHLYLYRRDGLGRVFVDYPAWDTYVPDLDKRGTHSQATDVQVRVESFRSSA